MTRPGDRTTGNPHQTRSAVLARNGLIATSQPLASAAGLKVLQDGGNAIDAAVTAAAVLAVVEPSMTGIGGDLFAIVYEATSRTLRALNASGRSPYAATAAEFSARGLTQVPVAGALAVTVPGVVDGWCELLSTHGTISMTRAIAPAMAYARDGFAVSEIIGGQWISGARKLAADANAAATFLPGGRAPKTGEVFTNPQLAATLATIADGGRDAFYRGPVARAIAADFERRGGLLAERDFAAHASNWIQPISTSYRGYDVYELPPNTQGFVALEMLNVLEGFDVASMGHNSADYLHALAEAKRIAFTDRAAYLGDPDAVPADLLRMLISKEYAAARRREIDLTQVGAFGEAAHSYSSLDRGDTVYLTAADGLGNAISLIQSLFSEFGCGIVAGDTGIVLGNRGSAFNLTPGHPAALAPHKRPPHTLIPAFVMKDGRPFLSFGVMGGDHQAQGHTQVLANIIDFGMNVQEAGEAARVTHGPNGLQVESAAPQDVREALTRRGHAVFEAVGGFGGYQGIQFDPANGVMKGGSDVRKDGLAIGY